MFTLLDKRDIADPDRGSADCGPFGAGDRRGAKLQGDLDHLRQSGIGTGQFEVARLEVDIVHPVGHDIFWAFCPGSGVYIPTVASLIQAAALTTGAGVALSVVTDPDAQGVSAIGVGAIVNRGNAA